MSDQSTPLGGRSDYAQRELNAGDLHADPLTQFQRWVDAAIAAELPEPLAAALATADAHGTPSVRMILVRGIAADARTAALGIEYLAWFLPALALQFPLGAMMSTLRATGIAQPTMVIQVATVVLNAILAPILIAGWGTGRPLGVAGAAIASDIALVAAIGRLIRSAFPAMGLGIEAPT